MFKKKIPQLMIYKKIKESDILGLKIREIIQSVSKVKIHWLNIESIKDYRD